ncbi:TPA: hypothetical protein MBH58_003792, partial [Klebsiella pneumoniae]|nr:hypothetical protein [Klebsiella pneumoniae]
MQRRSAKQGSSPPGQPYAHEKYQCHSHDKFVASRHSNAHSDPCAAAFLTLNLFKCLLFNKKQSPAHRRGYRDSRNNFGRLRFFDVPVTLDRWQAQTQFKRCLGLAQSLCFGFLHTFNGIYRSRTAQLLTLSLSPRKTLSGTLNDA